MDVEHITWPQGFLAAGVGAGLKKNGKKDLALIASLEPAAAAGVFTRNRVQAAPVLVTREHVRRGSLRGIVCNSGRANACVGARGLQDARDMAAEAAAVLTQTLKHEVKAEEIAVASTGVIGVPLPMEDIREGIRRAGAALGREGFADAARAIMTTDTVPKVAMATVGTHESGGGRAATVVGMAKGSGMIHPDMATMLAFVLSDAWVDPDLLPGALARAVDASFNMITVDGDTSTNDMVLVLANGASGVRVAKEELPAFEEALTAVCLQLARAIARDGEGASKYLEVLVKGAHSLSDARRAARAVAGSALVKTAVAGADPNWGRILAAVGYAGIEFDPGRTSVFLGPVMVSREGVEVPFIEEEARAAMAGPDVHITVDLGMGGAEARAFGCDLTEGYVRINASYRS